MPLTALQTTTVASVGFRVCNDALPPFAEVVDGVSGSTDLELVFDAADPPAGGVLSDTSAG